MIPVQKVLVRYTVTAGVLEYAVPFALYGTGDVNVSWAAAGDTETQTRLAPGSDYSVTVFRDMTGGKVTLADGKVPAGATLAIESAVPLTQELDLSNTATVDTEATEGQLDRMVQMIQQLGDGLSRAVKVNATDSGTPEDLLASLYEARDAAKDAATAATASEQAAEGSEQAAATSALQAASSEQAAATSAEAADQSRAEAAASAAAASQSATAASQSAEAAAESESKAAGSAASILGLHVEVATLDPGLPASGDYDPETGILHLGIPKGDSGASAIATPTSLGSVMPQTGDEDGLELETDGKLRVRKASASQRGGVLASTTAAANTVPQAGEDGTLDASWVPRPDCWDMFPPFVPVPIWGATPGGSDGRRAIMPGEEQAREEWFLCDGGSDGKDGTVPDLQGRYVRGASEAEPEGTEGGSEDVAVDLSGSTGATTLSTTQIPSHTHPFSAVISTKGRYMESGNLYDSGSSSTSATGGNGSHTHPLSGSVSGTHTDPHLAMHFFIKVV